MEIKEWLVKARLLEIGDTLHISCVSSQEAYGALAKFQNTLKGVGFGDYSLVAYAKPQETSPSAWWVCIAKVPRTDVGYVKKASGKMEIEGNGYVSLDAQRLFQLAIKDKKSDEEVLALAVTDLETRYVKELLKTTRGSVYYKGLEV